MSDQYRQRLRQLQSLLEPGLRRMLLLSFVIHLIVPVILSGVLKITHKTPQLPVYRVNLVNKPVKNPRAGRPDASPSKKKKVAQPKPAKQIAAKQVTPKKVETKKPPVKEVPDAKALAKQAAQEKAVQEKAAQEALQKRLAEMQAAAERQKKLDTLKAAIAAQQEEIGKPVDAPVGEPDGTGDEIGISSIRYIEGFIKEQWRLSQYQLPNLDLEAEVRVIYSAEGKMRSWEFVEKSGNSLFDDSLRRAVLKSRDLGQELPTAGEFEIVFNLKDLQTR